MNVWVRRSVQTVVMAGGLLALGVSGAHASSATDAASAHHAVLKGGVGGLTSGVGSILGGNQVNTAVNAPVSVACNAVGVLGRAIAACKSGGGSGSGAHSTSGASAGGVTSGAHSAGGGNQVNTGVNAPVSVTGNAIGKAVAGGKKHAAAPTAGFAPTGGKGGAAAGGVTSGAHSILGGNQVNTGVNAPVNVAGNAAGVLGHAWAPAPAAPASTGGAHAGGVTSGAHSIGGGNQVNTGVNAPVNVGGNAIGILGSGIVGG
jgi:sRNA-binding carbon storage regulator CsrA